MLETLFLYFTMVDDFLWSYIALPLMLVLGIYFSFKSKFVQIRKFPAVIKNFVLLFFHRELEGGIHPLKAFFASIGGSTGIGNVVAICTAVQLGGPGALFWIWMTAIAGSVLKYSEIYLGVRYREKNPKGGYHGGPMFFLKKVFKTNWVPNIICVFLCIYGVEIYQFSVVADTVSLNFDLNKTVVALVLLGLVIGASSGGVQRVGKVCSWLIPIFIILYVGMGSWVLLHNWQTLPSVFALIFSSAFTGHAALGAFVGSGILLAISQGIRRGCYAGDIGIGYASVMHSETTENIPEKQAALAIFDIFVDSFVVCTTSVLIVLSTGLWKEPIEASLLVQTALSAHFSYMEIFMPFFLFLLGYTTIIAYFCTGIKCAEHLNLKYGRIIYYIYAAIALFLFSFVDTTQALIIMSITGALLLVLNLYGIFRLRHEISFEIP